MNFYLLYKKLVDGFKKRTYDKTYSDLEKNIWFSKLLFLCYGVIALIVVVVASNVLYELFNKITTLDVTPSIMMLLLFGLFSVLNFFLLMFIWLTSESSYYKNVQMFNEILLVLKEREDDDGSSS